MRSLRRLAVVFIALTGLAFTGTASLAQSEGPPPLEAVGGAVEMGLHAPGASFIKEIEFRNTSGSPLTITRAAGNCSCMGIIVRDKTIAPGKSGTVVLAIDSPPKLGRLTREMYIFTDAARAPLRVPVYADLQYGVIVNKGGVPEAIARTGVLTLSSADKAPFRVLSVNGSSPVRAVESIDPAEARTSHAVRFDLGDGDATKLPRFIMVETDHPGARLIPVRVSVSGVWESWRQRRRLKPVDEVVTLFPIEPGAFETVLIELSGIDPGPADTLAIESSNPDVLAEVLAVRVPPQGGGGAACDVRLTLAEGASGPFHTVLTMSAESGSCGMDVYGHTD